jgi:hypothetical protein
MSNQEFTTMNLHAVWIRRSTPPLWIRLTLLLLLLFATAAPGAHTRPRHEVEFSRPMAARALPVLAEGWSWSKLFAPIQSQLNSRARMIQFGAIVVAIGLYILMRK